MLAGLKFSKEKVKKKKKKKDKKKATRNSSSSESECQPTKTSPKAMRAERRVSPEASRRERTVAPVTSSAPNKDGPSDLSKSFGKAGVDNAPQISEKELNPQFVGQSFHQTESGSDIPAHLMVKGCKTSVWLMRKRKRELELAAGKLDLSKPLPLKNDPMRQNQNDNMKTAQMGRMNTMYARNNDIVAKHGTKGSSSTDEPLAKLNLEALVALENEEADDLEFSPAARNADPVRDRPVEHDRPDGRQGWRKRLRPRNDGREGDNRGWQDRNRGGRANDTDEDVLHRLHEKHVKKDGKPKLAAGYEKRKDDTAGLDANELAARAMEAMLAGDLETYNELTDKINQVPVRSSSSKKPKENVEEMDSAIPNEMLAKMGKRMHIVNNCGKCMDSPKFNKKRDIISESPTTYLCFARQSEAMTKWQLLIVPKLHSQAIVDVEEDCAADIRRYQRCIVHVYRNHGLAPVFIETVSHVEERWKNQIGCGGGHTAIEVIPIPLKDVSDAMIYTKKSLQEAEEWTSHKGVIDCPRGIQGKIPSGFTYLHLDIALEKGFAHVIEDPRLFPKGFGQSILHDILEVDRFTRAYATQEERDADMAKFVEHYAPLDWAVGSMET